MELKIEDEKFKIKLKTWEKILSLKSNFDVGLENIVSVSTDTPTFHKGTIRAPGTYIPHVIAAGTYRHSDGKEFWLYRKLDSILTINLENDLYDRLLLGIDKKEYWAVELKKYWSAPLKVDN